jgi:hypothetical protein
LKIINKYKEVNVMKLFRVKKTDKYDVGEVTYYATGWVVLTVLLVVLILGCMTGCPRYNVWEREMAGKAEFARAEQNRRIMIEEAKANLEAEKLNAQAEVERAKGAAEAIKIENGSLTPAYIQYLWVRQQNLSENKVIYIPTEANLPILEAKNNR